MHFVKSNLSISEACVILINRKLKSALFRGILTLLIDFLAFLGLISSKLNQCKRNHLIGRLPGKMEQLAKKVPAKSEQEI